MVLRRSTQQFYFMYIITFLTVAIYKNYLVFLKCLPVKFFKSKVQNHSEPAEVSTIRER